MAKKFDIKAGGGYAAIATTTLDTQERSSASTQPKTPQTHAQLNLLNNKNMLLLHEQNEKSKSQQKVEGIIAELFQISGKNEIIVKMTEIAKQLKLSYATVHAAKKQMEKEGKYIFKTNNKLTIIQRNI